MSRRCRTVSPRIRRARLSNHPELLRKTTQRDWPTGRFSLYVVLMEWAMESLRGTERSARQ